MEMSPEDASRAWSIRKASCECYLHREVLIPDGQEPKEGAFAWSKKWKATRK